MNCKEDDYNLSAKKTTISLRNNANRTRSYTVKRASSKKKVGAEDEFCDLGLSGATFKPMFK